MRVCPSCGGIVGRDCFNPVECAQISEMQATQHDQDHYRQGYDLGYHEGYQAAKNEPTEVVQREAIGERKFTLKEMEDAFDAGVSRGESYVTGWGYENDKGCSTEYFKEKFGIDI